MKQIEVKAPKQNSSKGRIRPKVSKWKGIPFIRNHSFLATVNEICTFAREIDVVKVGLIGDMHSGKTTMAQAIGHSIHKRMQTEYDLPFTIRIFYEADLMNFQETLKSLSPANYVLIFDDVSFLGADKKLLNTVKQAVTKIRHLEGGQDVKIILVYNYHYTLGFDKYLRQADFRYFTSIGSSEYENMQKMVKPNQMRTVDQFMVQRRKAIIKKKWTVQLTPKEFFSYRWRDPFIPVLFFNTDSLRLIISPTREWLDKVCSICAFSTGSTHSEIPVGEFCVEGGSKFGERTFEAAVKLLLFENGLQVYAKSVMNAKVWLNRALTKKEVSLEQIMLHMGYTITKTRLRKGFSELIESGDTIKKTDTKKDDLLG